MRTAAILALSLFGLAPTLYAGETSPAVADAVAALREGAFAKVYEAAAEAPKDHADRPRLLYLAGEAHLLEGDAEAAATSFREVLELRPAAGPARVGLGRALALAGDHEEARTVLEAAIAADAKDAQAHAALGDLSARTGDLRAAAKELKVAAKLAPTDASVVRAYVEVLLRNEDLRGAERAARKLARADREGPMGPFLHALVLERKGDDDEAIEQYQAAIQRDDRFLDAHKNLAILCTTMNPLYQDQERTKLALAHYARYFELGGEDPELRRTYETLRSFLEQR